jgi:hypothetical protein
MAGFERLRRHSQQLAENFVNPKAEQGEQDEEAKVSR